MKRLATTTLAFATALLLGAANAAQAEDEYEVLPQRQSSRGHFWLSDGIQLVQSENSTVGNRFRLGGEFQFGDQYRYGVGLTLLDYISSGENSASVGGVSRSGFGPYVDYFIVPGTFWIAYHFNIQSVAGARVSGYGATYGHQLSVGYRFHSNSNVNWSVELAYLYVSPVTVPVFDVNLNAYASATYPAAQIWGLNLVFGFDSGG